MVLQEDSKKGWHRSGSAPGLSWWMVEAALGTGQGQALAQGYAEAELGTSVSWKRTSWRSQNNQKEGQRNGSCCPNLSNSSSGSSELKGRVLAASFPINSSIYYFKRASSSLNWFTCSSTCVILYILKHLLLCAKLELSSCRLGNSDILSTHFN